MTKPGLIFSLLLLAILLAQPGAASACFTAREGAQSIDGKTYYVYGDRRFEEDQYQEYLYQRWENVVMAKVVAVRDAAGNEGQGRVVSPQTFHFEVQHTYKGELEGKFTSVAERTGWEFCAHGHQLDKLYVMFLPAMPETGVYDHFVISSKTRSGPVILIDKHTAPNLFSWLDTREAKGVPLDDQGKEIPPP